MSKVDKFRKQLREANERINATMSEMNNKATECSNLANLAGKIGRGELSPETKENLEQMIANCSNVVSFSKI